MSIIRARAPQLRLCDALELSEVVQHAALAALRSRHPELSMPQLVRRLHGLPIDGPPLDGRQVAG
jgi:hypothetical protein